MAKAHVLLVTLVLLQICRMSVEARPEPMCPPCPSGGCLIPTNCLHGLFVDSCGRSICAKGPGERCKIKRFRQYSEFPNRICGDGLYCICGLCNGCSLHTYNCFDNTCIFAMIPR